MSETEDFFALITTWSHS